MKIEYKKTFLQKFFGALGVNTTLFLLLVTFIVAMIYIDYSHENYFEATVYSMVTQQHVSGDKDNVFTTYDYLVNTDNGTMSISPDGLTASQDFGRLKEGKKYKMHTRGYSVPLIGKYPSIIDVTETN